jgi:hypothetical protein
VPLVSAQRRLEVEVVVVLAEAAVGRSRFGSEVEIETGAVLAGAVVGRSRFGSEVEAVTEAVVGRQLPPTEAALAATAICSVVEIPSVGPVVDSALHRSQGTRQQPPRSPALQQEPVKHTHRAIFTVGNTPQLGVCI